MRTGWGVGAWSLVGLVTLGLLPLLVLGWGIPHAANSDAATRSDMPWNGLLAGLAIVSCVGILVARPILIPWTVVNARRALRRLVPKVTRFEPPYAPSIWQASRARSAPRAAKDPGAHDGEAHSGPDAGLRT